MATTDSSLTLRDRVTYLEDCLRELTTPCPADLPEGLRLTAQQQRVFGALQEAILTAMCWDRPDADWPEVKIVDVVVCKIRARLREAESPLRIETVWGQGYRLVGHADA